MAVVEGGGYDTSLTLIVTPHTHRRVILTHTLSHTRVTHCTLTHHDGHAGH